MMKNIFIFLEDKLSIKLSIIKLFILSTIFLPKSLYALSGKEINNLIIKKLIFNLSSKKINMFFIFGIFFITWFSF